MNHQFSHQWSKWWYAGGPWKLNNPSLDISNPVYTDDIAVMTCLTLSSLPWWPGIFLHRHKSLKLMVNKYIKDSYAFEKKLTDNTSGLLNRQLKDIYPMNTRQGFPLIIFNSVIKSDGRKMMISTQPLSFMMKTGVVTYRQFSKPGCCWFCSLFRNQSPMNLRMLTALRNG